MAGAQKGRVLREKAARSARWTVPDTRWPWGGGHMKEFGFISKYDGRLFQTYFAGLSQSMNSRAQALDLSNHLPFSHSMPSTQLMFINITCLNDFEFWM